MARRPFILGLLALLMWSLSSFLMSELIDLPVFEMSACVFCIPFILVSLKLTLKKQWHRVKQPIWVWAAGTFGIAGSDFCYIAAFKHAPPAHIDFIDYLWPFILILMTGFLPSQRLQRRDYLALSCCFVGVYCLLMGGQVQFLGLEWQHSKGYLLALGGALCWTLFNLSVRLLKKPIPIEMYGMYAGMGALFSGILQHYSVEHWRCPNQYECSLLLLMGLFGSAYMLWELSSRQIELKKLGILAYFTPLISMSLLILSGKQAFSMYFILACLCVAVGVVIQQWPKRSLPNSEENL